MTTRLKPTIDELYSALKTLFQRCMGKSELSDADRQFNHAAMLQNEANRLHDQSLAEGDNDLLEQAIALYNQALSLFSPEDHALPLSNLGNALLTKFEHEGKKELLRDALKYHRAALDLCPPGHPKRAFCINNLVNSIYEQYAQGDGLERLDEALLFLREALALRESDDPQRSLSLNNLGNAVLTKFKHTGDHRYLEEATDLHREALSLRPPGDPGRDFPLINLSTTLFLRFDQEALPQLLDEAIEHLREALTLRPPGHHDRGLILDHLASALITKYEQQGHLELLTEGIDLHGQALSLRDPGHFNRCYSLTNLAGALLLRAGLEGSGKDLDVKEAVDLYREALESESLESPEHAYSMCSLSEALIAHYKITCNVKLLEEAVALARNSLQFCSEVDSYRTTALYRLAVALAVHYDHSRNTEELEESLSIFEIATKDQHCASKDRLLAAFDWVSTGRKLSHPSTIRAYSTALELLEHCLAFSPTVEMQHQVMKTKGLSRPLATEAASYAIKIGNLDITIEFLEQGRAILWSQMRGFRTPMDQLREVDQELANRFIETSRALESLALSSKRRYTADDSGDTSGPLMDSQIQQKRSLVSDLNDILDDIRTKHFKNFLQAQPFSLLQRAAKNGPVIVLNHHTSRTDALIVLDNRLPVHVPLSISEKFREQVTFIATNLNLVAARASRLHPLKGSRNPFQKNLHLLWSIVGRPVAERLRNLGVAEQSRIWWCPTSILSTLPIHAAGPVMPAGDKYLCNMYISSYTPTLTALIVAQEVNVGGVNSMPRVLAIQGPNLLKANEELRIISQLGDFVTALSIEHTTPPVVLQHMQTHSWIHFACHGHLSLHQPFESSFELLNEHLSLHDIVNMHLPQAELAFLAACHSAAAESGSEEVLHLAAAMQFCGFQSVIGTLWEMEDEDGPELAKGFYQSLLALKEGSRGSARALNDAIKGMRRAEGMTLERWATFVHIGA